MRSPKTHQESAKKIQNNYAPKSFERNPSRFWKNQETAGLTLKMENENAG